MSLNIQIVDQLGALITSAIEEVKAEYAKLNYAAPNLDSTEPHPLDAARPPLAIRSALQVIEGASAQLSAIVASPAHTIVQRSFAALEPACLRVATEARVPDKLLGNPEGVSVSVLSEQTGIEQDKLGRVLRHLATKHIFREVSPNVFANNRLSAVLVESNPITSNVLHLTDEVTKASTELYDTLVDPTSGPSSSPKLTPFNRAYKYSDTIFQYFNVDNQAMGARFSRGMVGWGKSIGSGELLEAFPWKDLPEGTRVADVGGGVGATSIQIAKAFPHLRVTLQDLPKPIEQARDIWAKDAPEVVENKRVDFVPIDFFKESPVLDCDFYFLKNIMHDWPNAECGTILRNVAKSMKPNSRLLIQEYILQHACSVKDAAQPQAPAPLLPNYGFGRIRQYQLDLDMMLMLNAKERMLDEFVELGKNAGLTFVKFWDLGENGLVEFKLA